MKNPLKYEYTPNDWRKYTTSEERQALQSAFRQITKPIMKSTHLLPLLLYGPVSMAAGWPLAAVTPTWDAKDLKEYGEDKNAYIKSLLIPGYYGYKQMKALGGQRAIQARVEEAAKKAKEKVLGKTDK